MLKILIPGLVFQVTQARIFKRTEIIFCKAFTEKAIIEDLTRNSLRLTIPYFDHTHAIKMSNHHKHQEFLQPSHHNEREDCQHCDTARIKSAMKFT